MVAEWLTPAKGIEGAMICALSADRTIRRSSNRDVVTIGTPNMAAEGEKQRALGRLETEVREGLEHGFFDLSITCEVIKDGKRRLIIKAGKSYQFVIPEQELFVAK